MGHSALNLYAFASQSNLQLPSMLFKFYLFKKSRGFQPQKVWKAILSMTKRKQVHLFQYFILTYLLLCRFFQFLNVLKRTSNLTLFAEELERPLYILFQVYLIIEIMEGKSGGFPQKKVKDGTIGKVQNEFDQLEQKILLKATGRKTNFQRKGSVKNLRRTQSRNKKFHNSYDSIVVVRSCFWQAQLQPQLSEFGSSYSKKTQQAQKQAQRKILLKRRDELLKYNKQMNDLIQQFNSEHQALKLQLQMLQESNQAKARAKQKRYENQIYKDQQCIKKRILELIKPFRLENLKNIEKINDRTASQMNQLQKDSKDFEEKAKLLFNQRHIVSHTQMISLIQGFQFSNKQVAKENKLLEDLQISKVKTMNQIKYFQSIKAVQSCQAGIFEAELLSQNYFKQKIDNTNKRIQKLLQKRQSLQKVERSINPNKKKIDTYVNEVENIDTQNQLQENSLEDLFAIKYSNMQQGRNIFEQILQRIISLLNDRLEEDIRKTEESKIRLNNNIKSIDLYHIDLKRTAQKVSKIKDNELNIKIEHEMKEKVFLQNSRLSQEKISEIRAKQQYMLDLVQKISKSRKKEDAKQLFQSLCMELNLTAQAIQLAFFQVSISLNAQYRLAELNQALQQSNRAAIILLNRIQSSERRHQNTTMKYYRRDLEQLNLILDQLQQIAHQKKRKIQSRAKLRQFQDLKNELTIKRKKYLQLKDAETISKSQYKYLLRLNQLISKCDTILKKQTAQNQKHK